MGMESQIGLALVEENNLFFMFKNKYGKLILFLIFCLFIPFLFVNAAEDALSPLLNPIKIIISEQSHKVFVLNFSNDGVIIFDEEGKIISNISTGGKMSTNMLMDNDGNLYVLNQESNNITVFPSIGSKDNFDQGIINKILEDRYFIDLGFLPNNFAADFGLNKIYAINTYRGIFAAIDIKNGEITKKEWGHNLNTLSVSPKNHKIYLTNYEEGLVYIIDEFTNNIITNIFIGTAPFRLEIGDNNQVFVTNQSDDLIYVIDGEKDKLTTSIKGGGVGPSTIAINNTTKKAYIGNAFDDSISVIDVISHKLVKNISLPNGTYSTFLSVDEDNNLIFSSNQNSNSVSIIDGQNDDILSTLNVGLGPQKPVIDYSSGKIYIANFLSSNITIISWDNSGKLQTKIIPSAKNTQSTGDDFNFPHELAFNEEKNELYALNNGGNLLIIDGKNYKIKKNITIGKNLSDMIFIPELNKIFVSAENDNKVISYNLSDNSQKSISVGTMPFILLYNSGGQKLYVLNYDSSNVSVIDANKEENISNIDLEERCGQMALNTKTNKLYLGSAVKKEILIINTNTDKILKIINTEWIPKVIFYDKVSNKILALDSASQKMVLIDGESDDITGTFKFDTPPTTFYSDEKRNVVYFGFIGKIGYFNPSFTDIIYPGNLNGIPVGITSEREGNKVFILQQPRMEIGVADLKNNELQTSVIALAGKSDYLDRNWYSIQLKGIILTPDNKLFVALGGANALAVVDTEKGELEAVIYNGGVERIGGWMSFLNNIPWFAYAIAFAILFLIIGLVFFFLRRNRMNKINQGLKQNL